MSTALPNPAIRDVPIDPDLSSQLSRHNMCCWGQMRRCAGSFLSNTAKKNKNICSALWRRTCSQSVPASGRQQQWSDAKQGAMLGVSFRKENQILPSVRCYCPCTRTSTFCITFSYETQLPTTHFLFFSWFFFCKKLNQTTTVNRCFNGAQLVLQNALGVVS